jgi:hypothetical protein
MPLVRWKLACPDFAGESTLAAQGAEAAGGDITPERCHFAALLYCIYATGCCAAQSPNQLC